MLQWRFRDYSPEAAGRRSFRRPLSARRRGLRGGNLLRHVDDMKPFLLGYDLRLDASIGEPLKAHLTVSFRL